MMAMPSPVMAVMPAPVTVMMTPAPATVIPPSPVMVMTPMHFRGHLLFGILLHRRRSARIDQRYRLRALDWSRHHKQCADSRKTQNFRSVHPDSPQM